MFSLLSFPNNSPGIYGVLYYVKLMIPSSLFDEHKSNWHFKILSPHSFGFMENMQLRNEIFVVVFIRRDFKGGIRWLKRNRGGDVELGYYQISPHSKFPLNLR